MVVGMMMTMNLDGGGGSSGDLWQSGKETFSQCELSLQFSIIIRMMIMMVLIAYDCTNENDIIKF